jgi:hypothetical protein
MGFEEIEGERREKEKVEMKGDEGTSVDRIFGSRQDRSMVSEHNHFFI